MTETPQNRIRRLTHRACYTGMRETDRLLGGFARAHLATMDEDDLAAFEALLAHDDATIWGWASGRVAMPADIAASSVGRMVTRLAASSLV